MPFEELKIKGAWIHTPIRHKDERGHFEEQFKLSQIENELGRPFEVKQVNQSFSKKGVIRGIHVTDGPTGQAKYVSCVSGRILDIVIDLRRNSAGFGCWDFQELSVENGRSILISEGMGHAFLSLEDGSIANYLCTSEYGTGTDLVIDPFDKEIALPWEVWRREFSISSFSTSKKDSAGISLADSRLIHF